ncbi:MAG: response regulator transcription factor [Polyangiaceae bacterium]|nr:response regulator transcription factor [Polyangiaceae bacterium]
MRVLVCEDQDAIRQMITTLVGSSGHEVVGVSTGAMAVELATAERFDILLLDLMLPGQLDGFQVCERLRAQDATKTLPIFVISAMDDSVSRARAKAAGATDFFGKPFRPLELLKVIQGIAASRR